MRHISVLGSTGSIGRNALDVMKSHKTHFKIDTLTGHTNYTLLAQQAVETKAKTLVITDESYYLSLKKELDGHKVEILVGESGITEATSRTMDLTVSALVGISGLAPSFNALKNSKSLAIANKETIVAAGPLFLKTAAHHETKIFPIDSEHNGIFQTLQLDHHRFLTHITLTASGGPFRTLPASSFKDITIDQALKHPNWSMGSKNTIDSATLANKGLELIEASYLFNIPESQINIVIHPQSIIHSLVTFEDGSTLAQLSNPDMRVPISLALGWPNRLKTKVPPVDLSLIKNLYFEEPDLNRFPALNLARKALKMSQSQVIAFNAANEIAVDNFLKGHVTFLQIPQIIEETMDKMPSFYLETLDQVIEANSEALRLSGCNSLIKSKK